MNRLATCVAAIAALIAGPGFAADIAVKAAAPSPAPVYNWTGWYVGVNAGASFGNVKTDFNVAPVSEEAHITTTDLFAVLPSPGFAGSNTESPSGFIGGGEIG